MRCKILILERQKGVVQGDNSGKIILNVEYGKENCQSKGDNKNDTHYSRYLCSNGEQLWVEYDKSTTCKVRGQDRHYDGDMNYNEYWWHGGGTNHGNNVYNNNSKEQKWWKEITSTYNLTLPWLTILMLIAIKISMNKTLNIVAWNANGINGRWCHLDDIRQKHHITFVE